MFWTILAIALFIYIGYRVLKHFHNPIERARQIIQEEIEKDRAELALQKK